MVSQHAAIVSGLVAGGAALSILLGRGIVPQALLIFATGLLATGKRYRWIYILYKTLPRDLKAVKRFLIINFTLTWWAKQNLTIPKVFTKLAQKHPNKIAFYFEDKEWTYGQVEELSNQIANYFKSQGFKRKDVIALIMENRPEYVCTWLGLSKVGIVTALINSNLRQGPLLHSITVANSTAIIFGSELSEGVKDVVDSLKNVRLYQLNDKSKEDNTVHFGATSVDSALTNISMTSPAEDMKLGATKDQLVYIYTSGTTGLPKAAVVTNLRFMMMAVGVHYMLDITESDRVYNPLPLYHTAGGMVGIGQCLLGGTAVAIRRKFSASNFWLDCIRYDCTVAQYIGEICRYLLSVPEKPEDRLHRVRVMFGNGLRAQIWKQFTSRFNVKQIGEFYGATEGNSNIVNIDGTVGAVGFIPRYATPLYPVVLVKIDEQTGEVVRDKNGFCIRCKPGEPGLFVGKINPKKAISNFNGYADKKESEKKILRNVFAKGDQAFNSGDILVMDEFGYFYFKDRTGDTFRWRGENVATSEVEAVISNVVSLKDVVVYGVEVPHTEGKAGMAAIVDEEGSLDLNTLASGIKKNLPTYAWPLFIRVLAKLPMTGTYKLIKRDLQVEGFDINKINDKVYFMDKGCYIPLSEELYKDVVSGKVRL